MSEHFNKKDYSDYFSAVERNLAKKAIDTNRPKNSPKKLFGGIIKLRPWVYAAAIILTAVLILIVALPKKADFNLNSEIETESSAKSTEETVIVQPERFANFDSTTAEIDSDIKSQNIIVINCTTNKVVASRNADVKVHPASTTKIMTLLTATRYIQDYNLTFTFSYDITDPLYLEEATVAGFADEETVSVTDMFYGAILPSGADATVGIANIVAGSEEKFVELMNKTAKELGLENTNFTNSSGLYDKNHYTTAEDMAVIIREALKNELCKKVLSTYQYTTEATPQNPDGILLTSTLFSYMYGTEPEGAEILGGKTGFVNESGYCIATFGISDSDNEYVCVTLNGPSVWPAIYDQINLYSRYAK